MAKGDRSTKGDLDQDRERRPSEPDEPESVVAKRHRPDENPPNMQGSPGSGAGERHAVGGVTGGTPVGGLAGTNEGHGDPDPDEIDEAVGSSDFDRQFDADQ